MYKNRKGFTLIELLIVVVIIGILAAIAIPKFSNTKEKAYLASMKSDLRNLATAQEAYASDHDGSYLSGSASNLSGTVTPLADGGVVIFTPSSGVSITVDAQDATATDPAGWKATATHVSTMKSCAMFVGLASGDAPATTEGEPRCET
jgi:type IV pilus assembly protein PilA